MTSVNLLLGDCLERMREIADGSVDAIITDPPYPEISRAYGRMTEPQWHAMMDRLVPECRRVLKPSGSAVFVLQPNSERVGRMRPWLFEFQAKWCREWGMVQDHYCWNHCTPPTVHCQRKHGLARPSVKACVWLGEFNCYRRQDEVLCTESDVNMAKRKEANAFRVGPSGLSTQSHRIYSLALERGGSTPFNLLPISNTNSTNSAGSHGHGAGTPHALADWWVRYISPPGGVVLDPFVGSGTVALAALARGRSAIGIERDPGYFATAERRIADALEAEAA